MPEINFFRDPLSDNILQERDAIGALTAEYTAEPSLYGNVISQSRSGAESQFHFDALGSTLTSTDDNQQVTDTIAYSAFGEVTERTGATETPFQYCGEHGYYKDELTGDYIVRRRKYDPQTSRWLSADPIREEDMGDLANYIAARMQAHLYSYAANNPLRYTDPSGLQLKPVAHTCGASNKPNPGHNATIKCEEGKLVVFVVTKTHPDTKRPWDPCVIEAFKIHEEVHIKQFNKWCPGWCESPCSNNGKFPLFPVDVDKLQSECDAYKAERDALLVFAKDAKKRGCNPQAILDAIDNTDWQAKETYLCRNWPAPLTTAERSVIVFGK